MTLPINLRMKLRDLAVCLLAVTATAGSDPARAAPEAPPLCANTTIAGADEIARAWQAALMRNDADVIAALYAEDAVLMPSDRADAPLSGRKAIRDYYAGLAARHPRSANVVRSVRTGCDRVTETGLATFRVIGRRKGTRMLIGGHFSATYAMRDGAWWIFSHTLETLPLGYARALPGHSETFRPN